MSLALFIYAYSQDKEDRNKGFQKDRLFTGGSTTLSFFTGGSQFGIAPHFGYSLTTWADVAAVINLNYQTQRDYNIGGDKVHQTIYGPGAFVRVFPLRFLFAQAQFEHNFIHLKYFPPASYSLPSQVYKDQANSLLVGAGYCGGRGEEGNTYYYFAVLWDVLALPNSPYVDSYGRTNPIIKAGFNIGLFGGGDDKYEHKRKKTH